MNKMASLTMFTFLCSAFLSLIFSIDHHHHVGVIAQSQNNINLTLLAKLNFPINVSSSGSLTFDVLGRGPYAGTRDGRILFYSILTNSFKDFSYTSLNRTKAFCDGTTPFDRSATCGYTTGLSFDYLTQKLYAGDTYVGLTVVLLPWTPAVPLVRNADATPPFKYLVAVDYASDGMVYFVDASSVYGPKDVNVIIQTGDATGRLLKYNPITKTLTTLLTNLSSANGVATSSDASFVLVTEGTKSRIQRYWLKGGKAGTSEIFTTIQGRPNKIKRTEGGDFWVGTNVVRTDSTIDPQGVKFNPSGEVLANVDFSNELNRVTVVAEQGGKLYAVGTNSTFIPQYNIVYS